MIFINASFLSEKQPEKKKKDGVSIERLLRASSSVLLTMCLNYISPAVEADNSWQI